MAYPGTGKLSETMICIQESLNCTTYVSSVIDCVIPYTAFIIT